MIESIRARLDQGSAIPLYQQLSHCLREAIDDGALKPGDRLDSERLLTEKLGLSRSTVRAALSELIDARLIASTQGRGSFVLEPPESRSVRILIPERFRAVDLGPHPVHYDLLHRLAAQVNCRIRYEYVPDPAMLESIFAHAAAEYHGIAFFRPVQTWIDRLLEITAGGHALPLPALLINRDLSASPLHFVTSDHLGGIRAATELLLREGHRRIAYLSADLREPFARQALLGYRIAMDRLFAERDENLILECRGAANSESVAEESAAFLLRERPTGVVLGGTVFPGAFEKALERLGWHAPENLSVVACSEETGFTGTRLNWTAMIQPIEQVTQRALEALCGMARGRLREGVQEIIPNRFQRGGTVRPVHGRA